MLVTDVTDVRERIDLSTAVCRADRRRWWRDDFKRWVECPLAIVLLLACSPLLCLIALVIRLTSRGPVIYRRRVAGRHGEFNAFKFRTMVHGAERILETDARLREAFTVNW